MSERTINADWRPVNTEEPLWLNLVWEWIKEKIQDEKIMDGVVVR